MFCLFSPARVILGVTVYTFHVEPQLSPRQSWVKKTLSRLVQPSWLAWILLGIGIHEIKRSREMGLIFPTLGLFLYCLFSSDCLFPLKSHSELPNLKCINQLSASGICQAVAVL